MTIDLLDRAVLPRKPQSPMAADEDAPAHQPIAWHGEIGTPGANWWRGHLRDACATLLSLGLYRCHLRTRLRQRIWNSVHIAGVPLRYTGSVRDLLVPALAALGSFAAVALGIWILTLLAVPKPRLTPSPWRFLVTVPLVYLLGLAAWRHRAFLVEHTALGRLAGRLEGSRHAYALRHLATAISVPLTLGWVLPFRQVIMQRHLIEGMQLGPHRFTFEGDARQLLHRFSVAWAGAILLYLGSVLAIAFSSVGRKIAMAKAQGVLPALDTGEIVFVTGIAIAACLCLGLLAAWYRIGVWRRLAGWTRMDGRPLRLDVGTPEYLALVASNISLRCGSLLLLSPVAEECHLSFLLSRLRST